MNTMEILDTINEAKAIMEVNKAFYFSPYLFQKEIMQASKTYNFRFACLANQIGKSYYGGMETSYHLTGLYPLEETHGWDWDGHKFESASMLIWAVGISLDSTRSIMQKELIGTENAKNLSDYGKGSIPLSCIDLDSIHRDGERLVSIKIKHHNRHGECDGWNTLEFRAGAQGHEKMMGHRVHFVWQDEEDAYKSEEIFAQLVTRTTNTNGLILVTATPEAGFTALIQQFEKNDDLFLIHRGWNAAPHLTPEIQKRLLAGIPEWQIPCRTEGIPSRGAGQVFKIDDESIRVDSFIPLPHWPVCAGVDFGKSVDPSTVVFVCYDPEEDQLFIYDEVVLDNDRSPMAVAKAILSSNTPNVPVVVPHDANALMDDGVSTRATIMRECGCNVMHGTFSNPANVQNKIINVQEKNSSIEGGLAWMSYLFEENKLFVAENCIGWFNEKRTYQYQMRGGKFTPRDKDNHLLDASRYSVLSIGRYGVPFGQCATKVVNFNNGFDSEEPLVITTRF